MKNNEVMEALARLDCEFGRRIVLGKPTFEVGDKVQIIGNIPFHLKKKDPPYYGRITEIDGWYIYVKPHYQRWEGEFYSNELKLIEDGK